MFSSNPTTVAILYAKNLASLREFYASVVALELAHLGEDQVDLCSSAGLLTILAVPEHIARTIEITSPPERRTETPIKLVFSVPSISTSRGLAVALGGLIDTPEQEWEWDGFRICDGHDPEGNVFQVRERLGY